MNEAEAVKTPDRNVDLELASGGGLLLRATDQREPSPLPRERVRKPKLLAS
jgi:hypothetical protein